MPQGKRDFPQGEEDLVGFLPREKGTKLSFPKEKGVGPFTKEDGVGFSRD